MKKKKKDGFSLKKRIQYWFDNRIANGSLGLIRALIAASLVMAVLIAGLILLFGFEEDSEPAAVIWDSIATVINAWMPYWDEGSLGYLLLMSVTAIAGVLFTSVLIGIVTSAIEDKISDAAILSSRNRIISWCWACPTANSPFCASSSSRPRGIRSASCSGRIWTGRRWSTT